MSKAAAASNPDILPRRPRASDPLRLVDAIRSAHDQDLRRFLEHKLGTRDTVSDIVQEAYLRLCRQQDLEKIRGREKAYLFTTAKNIIKDRQRRRTRKGIFQTTIAEQAQTAPCAKETPESLLEYKETLATIQHALLEMNDKFRQVYVLRRIRQHSYQEIAALLGVSERTVERRMRRALRHLKEALLKSRRPAAEEPLAQ